MITLKNGRKIKPGELAVAQYVHLRKDLNTTLNKEKEKMPQIHLTQNYNVWPLAHELGHHFCFELYDDRSEAAADKYVKVLAKRCLSRIQRMILHIEISVYSGE